MITRQHLLLVLICSILLSSAIQNYDPVLAFLVSIGSCIGAILPDIQMKRPKKISLLTLAWGIVQAGRRTCIPVMCALYRVLFSTRFGTNDKRLTHSIPGIFLYFLLLSAIGYIPVFLFDTGIPVLPVTGLLAGLLFGMLLHLAEDACCRKGITPFYPFNDIRVSGSIRPCDVLDTRITGFYVYHGTVLFFLLFIQSAIHASLVGMMALGVISVCLCVGSMIWQSDVRIEHLKSTISDIQEVIPA